MEENERIHRNILSEDSDTEEQESDHEELEEIFSIDDEKDYYPEVPEKQEWCLDPEVLENLESELKESDERSQNIAQLMIDLQSQLEKSKAPATPIVKSNPRRSEPETPQFVRDFIDNETNMFVNTSKLLESQATKNLKADLSRSFETVMKLERLVEEKDIHIEHMQKQLQKARDELKEQIQHNKALQANFDTLESQLVQTKIDLIETEDRANTLEFQLQKISGTTSI